MTKTNRFFAILVLYCALVPSLGEETKGVGVGAYPLSAKTVSMWTLDLDADGKSKPTVLVYFKGSAGWHKRRWEMKSQGTSQRLSSGDLVLEVSSDKEKGIAVIQGREFKLAKGNVYLVHDADKPHSVERIQTLGIFELPYPSESPVALEALRIHP